tara:strand:- start:197 stop:355 length:159 start_codon:yes stop_codon:yes gene_type:complete
MSAFYDGLAMGGYAPYVWSAYGIGCVLLIGYYGLRRKQQIEQKRLIQKWYQR